LAQVAHLSSINRTPEIVAADLHEVFWALLGQHFLPHCEAGVFKVPPFATSSKSSPFLALQIHFKVFSTYNAIHLFEHLYRLHSCPIVTDDSSSQRRDGHNHFTHSWTGTHRRSRFRAGRMVCGTKGESERTVPSYVVNGGYYCRTVDASQDLTGVSCNIALLHVDGSPSVPGACRHDKVHLKANPE